MLAVPGVNKERKMAQDPIRIYLEAKANFDAEYKKIQNMQKIIAEVAERLKEPLRFSVSNVKVNFPTEVLIGHFPTLNADEWPSARKMAERLVEMDAAYSKAETAWNNLCAEDRVNLVELPSRREIEA